MNPRLLGLIQAVFFMLCALFAVLRWNRLNTYAVARVWWAWVIVFFIALALLSLFYLPTAIAPFFQ